MKSKILRIAVFVIVGLVLVLEGCESVDRGYEGLVRMTDPDKVRLRTDLKWMNPQPIKKPILPSTETC